MNADCTVSLTRVSFVLTAEYRAFRSLQAQPVVRMPVAQTPKDGTCGELCAAPGGHAELLQHQPRLLRPHRAGSGARARGGGGGGEQPERTSSCQDELRGEGSVQWTNTHVTAVDGSLSNQQFTIQEHARTGEKGHPDAGHCAWWVEIILSGWGKGNVNVMVTLTVIQAIF